MRNPDPGFVPPVVRGSSTWRTERRDKKRIAEMKTILLCGAALASLLALQGTSNAADARRPVVVVPQVSPWYASIFGGAAWPSTVVGQYYGSSTLDLQMDTGFIVGGTLGMYWHPNFRSEVELSFLHH